MESSRGSPRLSTLETKLPANISNGAQSKFFGSWISHNQRNGVYTILIPRDDLVCIIALKLSPIHCIVYELRGDWKCLRLNLSGRLNKICAPLSGHYCKAINMNGIAVRRREFYSLYIHCIIEPGLVLFYFLSLSPC